MDTKIEGLIQAVRESLPLRGRYAALAALADAAGPLADEVERLTTERTALLAPVEGVDLEEVARLDREGTAGPWLVENDSDGDDFQTWTWPWRIEKVATFDNEGDNPTDPPLIAYYRTAAPALAREVARLRDHVRRVEASENTRMVEAEGLRADLKEARLTLAAEQGRAEGAPSEGWTYDGAGWSKDYPDGSTAMVTGTRGRRSWMRAMWPDLRKPAHFIGRGFEFPSDRAAMLAADAATDRP